MTDRGRESNVVKGKPQSRSLREKLPINRYGYAYASDTDTETHDYDYATDADTVTVTVTVAEGRRRYSYCLLCSRYEFRF